MNRTLELYNRFKKLPFSDYITGKAASIIAPYFSSIRPLVTELKPGSCTVEMKDRRAVRNHLGIIHAIAMCNMAELAMGLALDASIPPHLRWIPRGMNVEYVKKAQGRLAAKSNFDIDLIEPGDIDIPVEIRDTSGDMVTSVTIKVYISEKPRSKATNH